MVGFQGWWSRESNARGGRRVLGIWAGSLGTLLLAQIASEDRTLLKALLGHMRRCAHKR